MSKIFQFRRVFLGCAVVVTMVLFGANSGMAQTNEGQLSGNVLDSTGAQVANAQITAKNDATGSTYSIQSTSSGSYRFASIALGQYTVTATASGFSPSVNTGVVVRVGSVTALDIHLAVGAATDTITVAANASTVETQSSDVGGTVTTRQIIDLPLALGGVGALRSPEAFVFLIPGTAGPGTGNSANGIFISKIGGGQNFGNEVLLDGASQTRSENGSSFDEEAPSVEAISEFKVTTNTPTAEFGRTSGGIENFVTKSGTNSYHGAAFDIFRNEDLNANSWFNNGYKAFYQSQGNPVEASYNRGNDKQDDYGGSMGGPIVIPHFYNGHDKSFFFFSWEQYRHTLGGPITSTVPTVAERGGDFSDQLGAEKVDSNTGNPILNPCDGSPLYNGEIFDPNTTQIVNGVPCRLPFKSASGQLNVIPQGRIDPVSQNILAYYPTPNSPGVSNNYTLNTSSPLTNTTYTIRIDHSIGSNDKFFGSYSSRENTRYSPQNFQLPAPVTPNIQTQDFITHFGRGGWDHIFTANLLNHLNIGYNRSNSINGAIENQPAYSKTDYGKQLGIPNVFRGFPRMNVDGYVSLSRNQDDDNIDNGLRFNDSVSWQKGRNSFKFGVDYRYQQYSNIAHDSENGYFNFNANQTKAAKLSPYQDGTGLGGASFLLGLFDNAGATIVTHQPRWLSSYTAAFAQDDFKASNDLVLNIGIRYSIDQPRKEATNRTSNFSPTAIDPHTGMPGALVFGTNCGGCNTRWADTWYKDIAPRIGFAYSPSRWNGKLAVRGGFATLYAPLQYSDFGGSEIAGFSLPIQQNSDGFTDSYRIDNGLNPYTIAPNLDPGLFSNGNSAAPQNFSNYIKPSYGRPAQVNQWNLQVQQELAKDLIMTIGYIGSSASHLKSGIENVNNISPSAFGLGDILSRSFATSAPGQGTKVPYATFNTAANYFQAIRPFPQYDYIATDCCLQNVGHSSYDALIATLERRFSHGLSLQASYTWSKSITNADSSLPGITAGVNQEQDPSNPKSTKALSIQDIPHTFVVSYIYQLPFGKGQHFLASTNGFVRAAISGFEIGAVQRYMSGQPTSFGCADGIPGYQNCIAFSRVPGSSLASPARKGHIDPFRRFRAGNPSNLSSDPNVDSEFNGLTNTGNSDYSKFQTAPAIYSQNNSINRRTRAVQSGDCATCDNGNFEFGDIPRVTAEVRNYKYLNEDFSFLKKTPITEGTLLILKVELLNAFNRHTFATPDTQPYDYTFGVPTSTINGPRQMQLTARFQF